MDDYAVRGDWNFGHGGQNSKLVKALPSRPAASMLALEDIIVDICIIISTITTGPVLP